MLQLVQEPNMEQQHARPSFWKSPFGTIATVVAVVAGGYLWIAHENHVLALLPFAFLAACPLMHVFMHRGHGHGGHPHGQSRRSDGPRPGQGG
jgi:hypothetical protein